MFYIRLDAVPFLLAAGALWSTLLVLEIIVCSAFFFSASARAYDVIFPVLIFAGLPFAVSTALSTGSEGWRDTVLNWLPVAGFFVTVIFIWRLKGINRQRVAKANSKSSSNLL